MRMEDGIESTLILSSQAQPCFPPICLPLRTIISGPTILHRVPHDKMERNIQMGLAIFRKTLLRPIIN